MSSPSTAQASPSSPRKSPTGHSPKSPGKPAASATSPPALIDTATQDQGQDAPIEADVSIAKSTANIVVLMLCA